MAAIAAADGALAAIVALLPSPDKWTQQAAVVALGRFSNDGKFFGARMCHLGWCIAHLRGSWALLARARAPIV
jgi:hypothetical protein